MNVWVTDRLDPHQLRIDYESLPDEERSAYERAESVQLARVPHLHQEVIDILKRTRGATTQLCKGHLIRRLMWMKQYWIFWKSATAFCVTVKFVLVHWVGQIERSQKKILKAEVFSGENSQREGRNEFWCETDVRPNTGLQRRDGGGFAKGGGRVSPGTDSR